MGKDVRPKLNFRPRRKSSTSDEDCMIIPIKKKSPDQVRKETLARQIVEKSRPHPDDRYTGGPGIDYHAHKRQFFEATRIDGLDDHAALREMRHWFGGTPWAMISGIAERRDATRALKEAWEELDDDYGQETIPAKERLAELLVKGSIDSENAEEHMILCADLRKVYQRAKTGGTHLQFDEPEIIQQILAIKMPYYHNLFLEKMEARMEREEKETDHPAERTKMSHLVEHIKRRAKLLMEKGRWKPMGTDPDYTNTNNNNNNGSKTNTDNNNNNNGGNNF